MSTSTWQAEERTKSHQINCADISITEGLHKFKTYNKVYQAAILAIYSMIEYKHIDK